MATKDQDIHIKKALPDERLFVLMARDPQAPATIIEWIKKSINSQPPAKLHEALDCAITMENQRQKIQKEIMEQNIVFCREKDFIGIKGNISMDEVGQMPQKIRIGDDKIPLKVAVDVLTEHLRKDPGLFIAYKSSIAQELKNEYWNTVRKGGIPTDINDIADRAAENFLTIFTTRT